jgi:hypothetical protein
MNSNNQIHRKLYLLLFYLTFPFIAGAQTTTYNQLCNEVQFGRSFSEKWAGELFLGGTFSSTPNDNRVLSTNIQRYVCAWGHYYFSSRWKFTGGFAYYYNKDVPDIGQYYSPEYRISLQATYYIHKTGYTLFTRMRGEIRFIMNADSVFEDKYRYRQMLKFVKPINGKTLRGGIFYFLATEELLFKPQAKTSGVTFFDRNRFEIGGGYLITDDIQVELAYLNEFMPRDDGNEMYNALEVTVTFNNFLSNLKKAILPGSKKENQPE